MAKSPTPIPAPPVKIQRDTNGAAPAAPAAKPKKAAPKKRRKRPLDICSLMDSSFLLTMMIPVIVMDVLYNRLSGISFSLLAISLLLFLNGIILYIPQFFPSSNKDARSLSRIEGFVMGIGGTLSVIPGLSGICGATSAGSLMGVERKYAFNMTLMMSMAYLAGMIVYDVLAIVQTGLGILTFQWVLTYLLTAVFAFVGAMAAISRRWFFLFCILLLGHCNLHLYSEPDGIRRLLFNGTKEDEATGKNISCCKEKNSFPKGGKANGGCKKGKPP